MPNPTPENHKHEFRIKYNKNQFRPLPGNDKSRCAGQRLLYLANMVNSFARLNGVQLNTLHWVADTTDIVCK